MIAAPPSVSNVKIIGDVVEGNIIKGVGDYLGGREGPSKFEWLRENKDTGLVFTFFPAKFYILVGLSHLQCLRNKVSPDFG